ncbi:MAG TPA: membrane protease subunit, stomatin/prohibitin, partial [Syntrophobacteraceae bacterium]|nr:membrane protease subunit, stomatin/prohibitin [Syntrophobacteraceae bacterium]
TLAPGGKDFTSDDPEKLPQRLINHVQVLTRSSLKAMPLRQALGSS